MFFSSSKKNYLRCWIDDNRWHNMCCMSSKPILLSWCTLNIMFCWLDFDWISRRMRSLNCRYCSSHAWSHSYQYSSRNVDTIRLTFFIPLSSRLYMHGWGQNIVPSWFSVSRRVFNSHYGKHYLRISNLLRRDRIDVLEKVLARQNLWINNYNDSNRLIYKQRR